MSVETPRAFHPSPSRPRVPTRTWVRPASKKRGDVADPGTRGPPGRTGRDGAGSCFDEQLRRQAGVAVGDEGDEVAQRRLGRGHDGPGDQHRVEDCRVRVRQQRVERGDRRARLGGEDPGEVDGHGRGRAFVVTQHQRPDPFADRGVLGGDDLGGGPGLGVRPRQDAVDRRAPPTYAATRPLVAHGRQGGLHDREHLGVGGVVGLGDVVQQPVAEEPYPVLGGGVVPVLLAEPGADGQVEQARVVHAQGGVAEVGFSLGERRPGGRGGDRLDEPSGEPLVEPDRPEARRGEQRGQLGEAQRLAGEPVLLGRRGGGQPDELVERREVALLHYCRDRHAVEDAAEELVHEGALFAGEALGRCRGERQDVRAVDDVEQLGEQPPPHLEQVVALVEDEHQPRLGTDPVEEGDPVGVQAVDDGGRVGVRGLRVEDGQGLVRQAGQRAGEGLVVARVEPHRPCLGDPLRLDGGVGGEHDGPRAGVCPELAGDGLQADAGLARPGRQDDPRPRVRRVVPRASECLERFTLVDAEGRWRIRVGHRSPPLARLRGVTWRAAVRRRCVGEWCHGPGPGQVLETRRAITRRGVSGSCRSRRRAPARPGPMVS
jgi:hypothetical protein